VDALLDLSRAYFRKSDTSNLPEGSPMDEYWHRSVEAFEKAKALDPDHPTVLSYSAFEVMDRGDLVEAARQFEHALNLHPNDWGVGLGAVIFCRVIGRSEVAVELSRFALTRDPLCTSCNYHYGRSLMEDGRFAEAIEAMRSFRELVPGVGGEIVMGDAMLGLGDYAGALQVFELRGKSNDDWYGPLLVRAYQGEDISGALAEVEAQVVESGYSYFQLAELFAVSGNADKAFGWLSRGEEVTLASRRPLHSRHFKKLHGDPRWQGFLERAGVAPHQLAKIQFNPKLPGLGLD